MSEPNKSPVPHPDGEGVAGVDVEILWVGKEDPTVRPRDPNVPIFWPDDIPLPGREQPKPPETPDKPS
jgi:hypothetical protein